MTFKRIFSVILATTMVMSSVPSISVSAETLSVETALETAPTLSGTALAFPETDDGSVISIFGSDNKQVIALDGTVYTPLVDNTVNLILKSEKDSVVTQGQKNVSVTVPGLYQKEEGDNEKPQTLPSIQEWKGHTGFFTLSGESKIVYTDESLAKKAAQIKTFFEKMLGISVSTGFGTQADSGDVLLVLDLTKLAELGKEGYCVEIADYVTITAPTELGVLYGGTTMTQIMQTSSGKNTAPKGLIRDYPAYEVRSVMIDIARPQYTLEFLKDFGLYASYYKLNELHLHLNEGQIKVQSEVYDWLNSDFAYDKAEYIAMEDELLEYGVYILNEIDTPGHSAGFKDNTADIPMYDAGHLDITTDENREKVEVGIKRLFDEFLLGKWTDAEEIEHTSEHGPIVKNGEFHIGMDEYLIKTTETDEEFAPKWAGYKAYTIDMLNYVNSKGVNARYWLFLANPAPIYGADVDCYPEYTAEELARIEHPEMVTVNIWNDLWGDVDMALSYGINVISSQAAQLYQIPGVSGSWHEFPLAERFDAWEVTNFYHNGAKSILKGHPQNRGASACNWFDRAAADISYSFEDLFAILKSAAVLIAEKTWHGDRDADQTGAEFEERAELLGGYAPLANPAGVIVSDTKKVAEYTFDENANDKTQNAYNATLTGDVTVSDGKLVFNGTSGSYMTLPFEKVGFPYTVSLDLTLNELPEGNDVVTLFSNADGSESMYIKSDGKIWYEYDGPCRPRNGLSTFVFSDYVLPVNEKVNLTFVCEVETNLTTETSKKPARYDTVLVVNDKYKYTPSQTVSAEVVSSRTPIQTAKIGEGLDGTIDNLLIYNVNALKESLSESDKLSSYTPNFLEAAYELEDAVSLTSASVTQNSGVFDTNVYHSGNGSISYSGKKRYEDLLVASPILKEGWKYVLSFWFKSSDPAISKMILFKQQWFPDASALIINENQVFDVAQTTDWQYVVVPFTVGPFHENYTGDTSKVGLRPQIWAYTDDSSATKTTTTLWFDRISLREVPAEEYSIICTESTADVNEAGNVVITNVYASKNLVTDGAKVLLNGVETTNFNISMTQSLTQDKTTVEIECPNALASGTYEIQTVLKDLWGKDVTSTLENVKYTNYTTNIFEGIHELEETSSLIGGTYTIDTSVYHSGNGSLRVDNKPRGDLWLNFNGNFEYGKDYVLSYWIKSSTQRIARPWVATRWYEYKDSTMVFYGGTNYMSTYLENDNDWQYVTETISFTHGDTDHYGGDENIHDHTTDTIRLDSPKIWFGLWSTYSEAGGEITTEPTVDHIWYDQIAVREIPKADEMIASLEKATYAQSSDGGLEVEFAFNSANVLDYKEYVTVDGVETPAQITHSVVDGKTVVKVKLAKDAMAIGNHTVKLINLKDIWNRSIADSSVSVYMLDHTVNLLANTYECDALSLFSNQWAWQSPGGSISTDVYYSGGSSLKVYSKQFCELNAPAQTIVPKNNTKYQYSFMIKTDGEASRLYIYRNYYCGESNTLKQFTSAVNLELTTEWQRVTVEFTDAIPETVGSINKMLVFAAPIGGDTVVRPYYIDCISLHSMPEDNAMLSSLENAEYKYGAVEFVFDTEYVTPGTLTVDGQPIASSVTVTKADGKTTVLAVPATPIADGTHTVGLSGTTDVWFRNVAASTTITTSKDKVYVENITKSVSGNTLTVTGYLKTNVTGLTVNVVAGVYSGTKLIDVVSTEASFADGVFEISETLDITGYAEQELTLKVICLDNDNNIIPKMDVYIG